ncbi:MAG: TIGR04282 family arsenosugar biosynthesis glycosyltransferase [Candidatus Gracilibacteria bacterium]|nr:TIGR04282 family arsenosugar biosynthesis glycosyltransferase [Candidatus Gracilibacteria bacterium]
MKNLVVLLTKYPDPGKVKTRLAKDIGFEKSAQIQELFIKNILKNNYFNTNREYDFKICLKEREKLNNFVIKFGTNQDDMFFPEGEDLGRVMESIFKQTIGKYDKVILIGSDIPLLNNMEFDIAFHILNSKNFVFGKALDGGYYLVGMSELKTYIFEDIIFSTSSVFDETKDKIEKNNDSFGLIDEKRDIDVFIDIIEEEKIDNTGFFKTIIDKINEK